MEFKPLNVQFEVDDEQAVDALTELATRVGKQRSDRRLRVANVAKEIVLRVMAEHPELLKEFFTDESGMTMDQTVERIKEVLPKGRSPRQAKK